VLLLQVFLQPLDGALEGVDLVFALEEAVAFARIEVRGDRAAVRLQHVDHLLRLVFGDACVVVALQRQRRRNSGVQPSSPLTQPKRARLYT